jgi:hypothetical protein
VKPSPKNRILLYLYSTGNIVGSALGLLARLLFFAGLIGRFWFFIVVGLYVIGVLAIPRRRTRSLRLSNELTAEEIRDELERLVRTIRKYVSAEVLSRVESIKNSIIALLPYIVDLSSSDFNIYTIRQTALEYLPETLENYLKLPRAFVALHPVRDGKTAQQLLLEQLDLLDRQMKEIAEDFFRQDTQALVAHGRFLEEKFGQAEVWFSEP